MNNLPKIGTLKTPEANPIIAELTKLIDNANRSNNEPSNRNLYRPPVQIAKKFDLKIRELIEEKKVTIEGFYVPAIHGDMGFILQELATLEPGEIIEVIVKSLEAGNINVAREPLSWREKLSNLFKPKIKPDYDLAAYAYLGYMNERRERIKANLSQVGDRAIAKNSEVEYYPHYNRETIGLLRDIAKIMELKDFPDFLKKIVDEKTQENL